MRELDYCVPLGIPHSVFLDWDEDDQDKALWWTANKRLTCESCGTRPEEWEKDSEAYTGYTDRCQGCRELHLRRKDLADLGEDERAGLRTFLIPTEIAMKIAEEEMRKEEERFNREMNKET